VAQDCQSGFNEGELVQEDRCNALLATPSALHLVEDDHQLAIRLDLNEHGLADVRRLPAGEMTSDRIPRRHVCKAEGKVQETGDVHLLVYRTSSIRQEKHPVVPVVRIPGR